MRPLENKFSLAHPERVETSKARETLLGRVNALGPATGGQ